MLATICVVSIYYRPIAAVLRLVLTDSVCVLHVNSQTVIPVRASQCLSKSFQCKKKTWHFLYDTCTFSIGKWRVPLQGNATANSAVPAGNAAQADDIPKTAGAAETAVPAAETAVPAAETAVAAAETAVAETAVAAAETAVAAAETAVAAAETAGAAKTAGAAQATGAAKVNGDAKTDSTAKTKGAAKTQGAATADDAAQDDGTGVFISARKMDLYGLLYASDHLPDENLFRWVLPPPPPKKQLRALKHSIARVQHVLKRVKCFHRYAYLLIQRNSVIMYTA